MITPTVTTPPASTRAHWAVRAGRVTVLVAALALAAPGEYQLARTAGWDPQVAWLMPAVLSLYAAVAALSARHNRSATAGALTALALARAAQIWAHLIAAGHTVAGPAVTVAVSAIPPLVAAHVMHLATPGATPTGTPATPDATAATPDATGATPTSAAAAPDATAPATPAAPHPSTATPAATVPASRTATAPQAEPNDDAEADPPAPVTIAEAARQHGVKPATVRSWITRGKLVALGKDERGRVLVDVTDARQ